jgi:hypothetical protein
MSVRRARRSANFQLGREIWMMSLCTMIAASPALGGAARLGGAGLEKVKSALAAVPIQIENQLAELKVSNIEGSPGRPIPLHIQVLNDSTADQLFIITGIPEGFTLSPGGYFGKFWAVNPKVLPSLTLTAPQGFSGSFQVSIVRRRDGAAAGPTASASFRVNVRDPATTATSAIASPPPAAAPPARPAPKLNPNEAAYIARGKSLLESGDISAARAIFENLALQGSAAGAMALGETYDPAALSAFLIRGLEPDVEKARKWYLKAEQLGGSDARRRLNELANR